ncbi:conserved Plasmodium protein, unknown function [Plasmodium yoelii]|uniref:BSD domain-containing protein n=2 Tax=Plasmodium yoelii TaxID=5861 RepID=A0AAE9WVD2_PLAYO|nr:conserved Plasmodium protein, unknown function [Plasmodium yoelii]WBY59184.1 BSD domain-containing protein [Plasmodium yoelii yoelii]CDU19347.1 conserved Plasmodium protein, unknown function [Plasmodium yoelii]VTZ79982.1 conserved Plasmodium protein, unknown function [Plasmodium yoelii]|eukprot:XP_022812615.1 conserved Plasmodium protein, unknown function [Plasmodium yoelii]
MEEEKIIESGEVIYNNEKGNLFITNKFLIYISDKTKNEKESSNSLFLIEDIDLKVCIFSWKKTEKSKKKNKIRLTFALTSKKNNFCFHDYNNSESYIFEFLNERNYNTVTEAINYLNKDNLKNHIYIDFNLNLIKNKYNVYEHVQVIDGNNQLINIEDEINTYNKENSNVCKQNDYNDPILIDEYDTKKTNNNNNNEKNANCIIIEDNYDGYNEEYNRGLTKNKIDKKNEKTLEIENEEDEDESEEDYENEMMKECHVVLNKIFESDERLKNLYRMCIENDILDEKEFYKIHKNDIYEHKYMISKDDKNILKEPIYISEEQKINKNVEINKEISKLILSENKKLKKLYDYYIENNILNEGTFWYFLFNNKYSHLFFYDKNEKDIMTNKNFLNIQQNNQHSFENLMYNLENVNQDIKGTLEKCILSEYLSTKLSDKKNVIFKNNYYFNEENPEGFGILTNEKLIPNNNNSLNLLINKFNNYCIHMVKEKKFTIDQFYDDLNEKINDTNLSDNIHEKKELLFNLEKKKNNICNSQNEDKNATKNLLQNKENLDKQFSIFMDDLITNRHNTSKNYSDLFAIGRQLFVLNTKKCQSNQSLLIGTIDYEQHILDIVKDYHVKINYLLNLFYTSYIPEQNKRNKILENLSKIKDEIQAKQEEYNSVLIMGKPLLIHLFEQITICKKFNEKLNKYIQEKRKKT